MRLVAFNAHQVRQGVCQRGAAKRQGPRTAVPILLGQLAENIVKLKLRDVEAPATRQDALKPGHGKDAK